MRELLCAMRRYWSDRREAWPKMVPQISSVAKVFGSRALERYEPTLTLWEATEKNDGSNAFSRLLKQSSAALLNAYAQRTELSIQCMGGEDPSDTSHWSLKMPQPCRPNASPRPNQACT
ncbi:hypothetical protein QJS10_CPB21g00051 [Acorus calamus]|uniref:Uncharacterized protein n=1 Tax=Acorus calamus TaxID=4465 RepID=A0AAV9C5C8_ACOCL|nr:hypothetical protein QJS10_CPB21g00051 [Acorus calamus]